MSSCRATLAGEDCIASLVETIESLSEEGKNLMQSLFLYGCRCPSRIGWLSLDELLADPAPLNPSCTCFKGMKVPNNETRRLLRLYQQLPEPTTITEQHNIFHPEEICLLDDFDQIKSPSPDLLRWILQEDVGEEVGVGPSDGDNAIASDNEEALSEEHNSNSFTPTPQQDNDDDNCRNGCGNPDHWEDMVACETEHAPSGRWFHLSFAGLSTTPEPEEKWFCGDCLNEAYEGVDDKVVDEDEEDDGDKEDDSDYNLRCQAKNLREGNTHSSRGGKRKLEPEAKGKQSESEPEATKKSPYASLIDPAQFFTPKYPERVAQMIYPIMREVCASENLAHSEAKFPAVSKLLMQRHSLEMSGSAVKNWWQRHGRALFGFDERKNPKPDKMITGVQRNEDRKRVREATAKS